MAAASNVPPSSSTSSPPHHTMSTHSTELVKGTHLFTVAGYILQKRNGSEHYIRSGSFEFGGYSWAVLFYPAGSTKEDEGHVIRVPRPAKHCVEKVTAKFSFHINGATASSLLSGEFYDFKPSTSSNWGFKKFMKIETVESLYLENDCVKMHCAVEVVKETKTGATMSRFITVAPPAICRHLEQLLESKQGSDVTVQVEWSKYDTHRAVLAARSPVFSAQFFGPMAREAGLRDVRIHDMKPAVFEAVLHFIYTDTLPPVEEEGFRLNESATYSDLRDAATGYSKQEVRVMVREWLAAADRFDLERMRLLYCENALCETIDVAKDCPQLKVFCMEYIASPSMLAAVMTTEGFKELKASCPSLVIEILEKLGSCSEE